MGRRQDPLTLPYAILGITRLKYDPIRYHILIDDLRDARRSSGWSQRTLADRIGVDAQTIKRLERGVGSVETLATAMEVLDFHLTGLGTGKTLAEQLKLRRLRRSLSLEDLAAKTGL